MIVSFLSRAQRSQNECGGMGGLDRGASGGEQGVAFERSGCAIG